jgi:glycosyltransferase involved in cell wall biosynthesis
VEAAAGGGAQGSQTYAKLVEQRCAGNSAIVRTGFLPPPEVHELLAHAGMFVLPSSHEGLPISLLEAMKLGTPVLASDIPANLEIGLDASCYFPVGDAQTLTGRLRELAQLTPVARGIIAQRLRNSCGRYDWDGIAESTLKVRRPLLWKPHCGAEAGTVWSDCRARYSCQIIVSRPRNTMIDTASAGSP